MKKANLLPLLFFLLSLSSFAINNSDGKEEGAVVVQLDGLTSIENVEIIDLFKNDAKLHVINTCQILGFIVFDVVEKSNISDKEAEAYLLVKLTHYLGDRQMTILDSITKDEVNLQCRQEVAKLQIK